MVKRITQKVFSQIQIHKFAFSTAYGKVFTIVLLFKIASLFLVAPKLYVHWFVPFIINFIHSGYQNPWDSFLSLGGDARAFPYGTGMLLILSFPSFLMSLVSGFIRLGGNPLDLFLIRMPILIADYCILYIIINLLNIDAKKSIYVYWCSPVVFYICYIFGQIDIIPMMLMFASLALLLRNRFLGSAIMLGIGMATKENLFFAVPFLMIYVFKKNKRWQELISYSVAFIFVYLCMIGPVFFSHGYQTMVLGAKERTWIFLSRFPFGDFEIFLLPLVMGFLYLKFSLYRKVNEDILIMYLGLAFTLLLLFIPAATPGWYMWIVPFLCYYFINSPKFNLVPLAVFSALFIVFFLLKVPYPLNLINHSSQSVLGGVLSPFLSKTDISSLSNLVFTFLQGIIAYIAIMMYFYGVRSNEVYKERSGPLIIGIGGSSGSGKDTLCRLLALELGKKNIIQTNGDDHHRWERRNRMWKVFTHLNPAANDLFLQFDHAFSLKNGKTIWRRFYDHKTGKFSSHKKMESSKYIIVSGLHPFYLRSMREMIDLKIYLDTETNLMNYWKIRRDVGERKYQKEEVLKSIMAREPDRIKFIEPQKQFADLIIRYELVAPLNKEQPQGGTEMRVKYLFDNSIDFENVISDLEQISTLKLHHQFEDVNKQCLAVEGHITHEQLIHTAFHVAPNIREIIDPKMRFEENLNGVTQLVLLNILSHLKAYTKL